MAADTDKPAEWTISEELYKAAVAEHGNAASPSFKEMQRRLAQAKKNFANTQSPKPPEA